MNQSISQGLALLEKIQTFDWAKEIALSDVNSELVAQAGTLKLFRYTPKTVKAKNPVLLIPSFINRHYILDLLPEKSLLKYYLQSGFEVYLLNWGEPEVEDKHISFETLFDVHLDYLFTKVLHLSNVRQFHIVGQCLGGNIGLLYSLLKPEVVKSLTLLTTPIDFDHGGKLKDWARHKSLDLDKFIEARGNAPWLWMQLGFLGMKPTQIILKYKKFFEKRNDPVFKRNFLALETWSFDNINVRGQFFLTLIKEFYQNNSWLENGFQLGTRQLHLRDLIVPVSVVNAEDDHIVPIESTLQKAHVPQARQFQIWNSKGGHIGALIGTASQKVIWPEMIKWLTYIDQERTTR